MKNKAKSIWGTSHFPSEQAAVRYYTPYENDPKAAVLLKLKEKTISIGKPAAKPGERIFLHPEEERYFIES